MAKTTKAAKGSKQVVSAKERSAARVLAERIERADRKVARYTEKLARAKARVIRCTAKIAEWSKRRAELGGATRRKAA